MKIWLARFLPQYTALYLISVFIAGANWVSRNLGRVNIDQVLYHLQLSSSNILKSDPALIDNAIDNVAWAPLAYALILLIILQLSVQRLPQLKFIESHLSKPTGAISGVALSLVYFASVSIEPPNWPIENRDWVAEYYAFPEFERRPLHQKNLVLIYAESLEASLATLYPHDPVFEDMGFESYNPVQFHSFHQLTDTGWTMAALVASQCGLPLKPLGLLNENKLGEATAHFLPRAKCLGDLLRDEGYTNVFMGGAHREFAGKHAFLQSHGYTEIDGKEQFQALEPNLPLNDWGINDDDLFRFAKEKYLQLKTQTGPFNLTVLTIGMHFPDGYLSPSCPVRYSDYRDAILCTGALLKNFVEFVKRHDEKQDTEIVIIGDHLTMKSSVAQRMKGMPDRSIFNAFIGPAQNSMPNTSSIDHFDLFPTILSRLNFSQKDGRAGLGCTGFGTVNCKTLSDDPDINAKLASHSVFYDSLWVMPP